MNYTYKLSALLFVLTAFVFTSCNQTAKNTDHNKETHETEHDNDENHKHDHDEENIEHDNNEESEANIDSAQTTGILNAYLALKDALVKSSPKVAQSAANEITSSINQNTGSKILFDILSDAKSILLTDEVATMRTHFDQLSNNVYALVKEGEINKPVYKQYCPMAFNNKGAFWLSSEKEIRNPYFGDKMLKCGKIQETLN